MKTIAKLIFGICLLLFGVFIFHVAHVDGWFDKSTYEVEGANGSTYESYQDACEDGDFVAAHKYLNWMAQKYEGTLSVDKYHDACKYVFQKESNFLISKGDKESAKRLIFLLEEYEHNIYRDEVRLVPNEGLSHTDNYYVNKHNQTCMDLLRAAITIDNQYVASYILNKILPDLNFIKAQGNKEYQYSVTYNGKKIKADYGDYYVYHTYDTKNEAKKIYKQAFEEEL